MLICYKHEQSSSSPWTFLNVKMNPNLIKSIAAFAITFPSENITFSSFNGESLNFHLFTSIMKQNENIFVEEKKRKFTSESKKALKYLTRDFRLFFIRIWLAADVRFARLTDSRAIYGPLTRLSAFQDGSSLIKSDSRETLQGRASPCTAPSTSLRSFAKRLTSWYTLTFFHLKCGSPGMTISIKLILPRSVGLRREKNNRRLKLSLKINIFAIIVVVVARESRWSI